MIRKILQIAVPFIWFGAVIAISFMEAPLKFQAPGITIPLGLGIGRLVFFALNKIELALAAIFLLSLFRSRMPSRVPILLFAFIAAILLFETVWLLPWLDARAELVINGTAEPFSRMHFIYIGCDAAKVILLLFLGVVVAKGHLKYAANP
jgi:hypothetical protein